MNRKGLRYIEMKKAVIYPFNEELIPLVRYWNLTKDNLKIVSAVMVYNKGLTGKDIGAIYNHPKSGITICTDLEHELALCDALIITEVIAEDDSEQILNSIDKALNMKKAIHCMCKLSKKQLVAFQNLARKMDVSFNYYDKDNFEDSIYFSSNRLYRPTVPVVMVGELFSNLDGIDVTLSINRSMLAKGYKSIAIIENKSTAFFDIHTYPDCLRSTGYLESDKIFSVNKYIENIEKKYKPDVIIMHIPDAMLKYNDILCNGFGVIPFLITQAVTADFFVFCSQYDIIDSNFFEQLSSDFEKRYGLTIDYIHMSNSMIAVQDSVQKGKLSYLHQTQERLNKLIEENYINNRIPIMNCFNEKDNEKLVEQIIDKFAEYATINSLI